MRKRFTAQEFIQKAQLLGVGRFDYSEIEYFNMHMHIKIRCIKHNIFFRQSPINHLKGKISCKKCKVEEEKIRRKNYLLSKGQLFFEAMKERFDDKYDYSFSHYQGKDVPIKIICPEHGEFKMTPANHKRSPNGCNYCRKFPTISFEKFLEKGRAIHGEKYDYSIANYKIMSQNIQIICFEHGMFEQTPSNHLLGYGCEKCGKLNTKNKLALDTKTFIQRAKEIHGDDFDYSKTIYKNNHTDVTVICKIHVDFKVNPNVHTRKNNPIRGCKECANEKLRIERSDSKENFIKKAIMANGDRYDYSLVEYKNARELVTVICNVHGEFKTFPDAHIRRNVGCPNCGREVVTIGKTLKEYRESGVKQTAYVYLIQCSDDIEAFIKIGITTKTISIRFSGKMLPYEYKVLYSLKMDLGDAYELEQMIIENFKEKFHYYPQKDFGGRTECFRTKSLKEILNFLKTNQEKLHQH